jgi:hypothetical protein
MRRKVYIELESRGPRPGNSGCFRLEGWKGGEERGKLSAAAPTLRSGLPRRTIRWHGLRHAAVSLILAPATPTDIRMTSQIEPL